MTMNDSRFALSVPRPQLTHDPMLGRLNVAEPVWMPMVAQKWSPLMFFIERMTQMSSIMLPMCGNKSLTSVPACPCLRNAQSVPL